MRRRLVIFLTLLAVVSSACGGGKDSPTTPATTVREVDVINFLYAGVTVSVDGTSYGAVNSGALGPVSAAFLVPTTARTVGYTIAKQHYSNGTVIPDDLDGESGVALPAGSQVFGLNNIVGSQAYITFAVLNNTGATITIGLTSNGITRCISTVTGNVSSGFLGYYALTSTSELHYYRGTNCTGPSRFWSPAQLAAYEANSGALLFVATTLP